MNDKETIISLLNEFANPKKMASFFVDNATPGFLFIRPSGNPTDAKIDSTFNKNVLGAPTTTNLPKGAVPDAAKKIKAKSKIKPFKRNKPK